MLVKTLYLSIQAPAVLTNRAYRANSYGNEDIVIVFLASAGLFVTYQRQSNVEHHKMKNCY